MPVISTLIGRDTEIPADHWPVSLVSLVSTRFNERRCLKKGGLEQLRKASNSNLWPLHAPKCAYAYTTGVLMARTQKDGAG